MFVCAHEVAFVSFVSSRRSQRKRNYVGLIFNQYFYLEHCLYGSYLLKSHFPWL